MLSECVDESKYHLREQRELENEHRRSEMVMSYMGGFYEGVIEKRRR